MKQIIVRGLAYDRQSSFIRGAADGPEAAVNALHCDSANLWTETGHDLGDRITLAGVAEVPEDGAFEFVEQVGFETAREGVPLFLGGDHSLTYPLLRGLRSHVGDFAVLHFDAHPDCYDHFEGNRLSHACPIARIMEESLCSRLVSVGIRTANGHQREQRERYGIEWLEMKDRAGWPTLKFDTPVYVSLDLDVLDPAFAPGVAHHEPGGMSVREVLDVIHGLNVSVIGADIVELNPGRDINGVTAMVAAKFMREIAGMMIEGAS